MSTTPLSKFKEHELQGPRTSLSFRAERITVALIAHLRVNLIETPDNDEASPGADRSDNEDAGFEYVKANTIPNWHACDPDQMLQLEDGGVVVDARLRVYGIDNLGVTDRSTPLPYVNILGSVHMIAENGAELIREDYDGG
ncbi:hypothetical protein SAPIO_CDS4098 [Scedosporium apiospermum]|uniref:Glucose-methanol-choline oxidoreductase C-terminal domain-containing protein n=1 Tax=Pseudallescheria apiosperma TaxID=563466 RepID=A0A084G9A2_PSEDA|nr:uncharacterized protein SAPIO_CDS4098 [Scedosporium apiospermum]KEZ43914.1 hypothetical protein SAPIO_CDS4098 [Scedosporium apiospermum]